MKVLRKKAEMPSHDTSNNPNGRPTDYDPIFIDKVDEYLASAKDEEYTFQRTYGKVDTFEEKVRVKIPSKDEFSKFIKVSRKTLYNWADVHPDFADALEKIDIEQKIRLINCGLGGQYSPVMSKMLLSANHGMREGFDATSNGKTIKGNTIVFKDFSDDSGS